MRRERLRLPLEVGDPLGGRLEAAEGVKVQLDHAVLARVEARGQVAEELVGPFVAGSGQQAE